MRRLLVVAAACLFSLATVGVGAPAHASGDVLNEVLVISTLRTSRGEVQKEPPHVRGFVTNIDTGVRTPLVNDGYRGMDWAFVPDGRYILQVWHDVGMFNSVRSATSWWPGVYSAEAAVAFTLRQSAPSNCDYFTPSPNGCRALFWDVQLEENRVLSGTVRERSSEAVPAAPVTATRNGEAVTRFSALTDESGRYSMSLPPGRYTLQTPNGMTQLKIPDLLVASAAQSADLVLADVPSPPREVTASAGSRKVSVTWSPPADTGGDGLPITGYRATAIPGGQSCSVSATGCTIDGLASNRQYVFTVTATNAVGISAPSSASNAVTPSDPAPDAPIDVRATAGNKVGIVTWSPPRAGSDTVTGYRVTSTPGGHSCATTDLTCDVPRLQNGVSYTFRVTATSAGGQSASSEPSNAITPAGVPSAPRNVQAQAGRRSLFVRWNAPVDDGGAPVTEYTATAWPGGRICTADDTERGCAIGGLTNSVAYSVTVTARNRVGISERSPGSIPVTPEAKLAPQTGAGSRAMLTRVSSSEGEITVRWSVAGAKRARISWQKVGGTRKTQVTTPSGRITLKGKPGERFIITVRAVAGSGERAAAKKVFRIPAR